MCGGRKKEKKVVDVPKTLTFKIYNSSSLSRYVVKKLKRLPVLEDLAGLGLNGFGASNCPLEN